MATFAYGSPAGRINKTTRAAPAKKPMGLIAKARAAAKPMPMKPRARGK